MDPVTHTLVGITTANAFLRRRAGREAVPILAWASNLPDLDGVVMLTGHPAAVVFRRTFGHSLFLLPLWSLLLALVLRRFYPRPSVRTVYGLVLLGAGLHLFFDLINSFGVVLLWPLSDRRPELAIVFIVDLVLTGLLALPILLAAPAALRPRRALLSQISAAAVVLYLGVCAAGHALAREALAREALATPGRADFLYVFPEPLGPHRWRGVIRKGNLYDVYLVHSFTGRLEKKERLETHPESPEAARARQTPLGHRLERFFKAPVWETRRSYPEGAPARVTAYDLRFRSLVLNRRSIFPFCFQVTDAGAKACRQGASLE
ncbi:MAG TPA: metal-dependent hydrolase [Candidatus Polarisedimenticolia bacterium]|jgi:inner membrane protein|nr:metal-dependent hydrolase [Candidatus Polarisedimenticolia bacterium]